MGELNFSFQFCSTTCCTCGIGFAFDSEIYKRKTRDHSAFYCPMGHSQHFVGESDVEKLRRELEYEKKLKDWARNDRDAAQARAKSLEHSRNGLKGSLTKIKRRVGNGVCPCCKRTFPQLSRHMKIKHPSYSTQEEK